MTRRERLGILTMIATMLIFAAQDGISKHLAEATNVMSVVLFRYWFFALFVIAISSARPGGLRAAARTERPLLQITRGILLVTQVCVMVYLFGALGLVEAHAIFSAYPLIIAALSGPFLGERVGWRRWSAIVLGFVGVLVILRPGFRAVTPELMIALLSATLFAIYSVLTRVAGQSDRAETSFFYTGIIGGLAITLAAPFVWHPMETPGDWAWMAVLCLTGAGGHFLLIQTYALAEASLVQPFAYFHLLFSAIIGLTVFSERPDSATLVGAGIILFAGLYTLARTRFRESG
ncbi:MAG: DMT family transporter [Pseudomonadota bacterium]